jgi:hypothetical protein
MGAIYHTFEAGGVETAGWEDSMRTMLVTLIRRDDPDADTPEQTDIRIANAAYEGVGTDEELTEGEVPWPS